MNTSTECVVTTHGLTKAFSGRTVVDSLDLNVPTGCVYGFLGPNGSGKSTTMKMLLGLLRPTRGSVSVLGSTITPGAPNPVMRSIGSMIETPPGYGHLTGEENMRIVQHMLGLSDAQVTRALDLVTLSAHKHRLQRTYSLGMKQRLGIAMALARDPHLLILDEPTNGLDPAGIEEMRELFVALAGEGISVMVSSHLLDEIDKMASHLGILSNGRLLFEGTRRELFARSLPDIEIITPRGRDALALGIEGRLIDGGFAVSGAGEVEVGALIVRLVNAGIPVYEVRRVRHSLEDVFMDITGRDGGL